MANGKRFVLLFVNAAEDIPRQIHVFARLKKGSECALVLRPLERAGLLVHLEGGSAWQWTAQADTKSDAPQRPETVTSVEDAVRAAREFRRTPGPARPISLHGQWSGHLVCNGGLPVLELHRKVASYGVLHVTSRPDGSWAWRVERQERWFSRAGSDEGSARHLVDAIQAGLVRTMGLLGEACSVRDSRRRAALDAGYAELHPLKPAKERPDKLDTLGKAVPRAPKPAKVTPAVAAPAAQTTEAPPVKRGRKPKETKATEAVPQPAPAPASRGRKPAPTASTAPGKAVPAAGYVADVDIDPAKDKLLMDAFSNALTKALGQLNAA